MADDVAPPPPSTVSFWAPVLSAMDAFSAPTTSIVCEALSPPSTLGGGGDGSSNGGGDGGSGSSGVGGLTSSLASASTAPPPSLASLATSPLSLDKEEALTKALIKAIKIFLGGSKAEAEWPLFWAQLCSIIRFPKYSANGPLVTTAANSANSNRLANLLTIKVGEPAIRPFFNNQSYVGKGFEMLARLCQTYAPSTMGDRFSNLAKLIFLEQGPQDSLEDVVSKIRQYAAMLTAGGWKQDEQMLTSILMKALDDRYAPIASDFSLNQEAYAALTLDEFEQKIIKWAASHKILVGPSGGASAASALAARRARASGQPSTSNLNAGDIKKLREDGKCSCGSSRHTLENCHAHRQAGFTITYEAPTPDKSSTDTDGFTPARSRRRGNNKKPSTASAATASPPPASGPAPPRELLPRRPLQLLHRWVALPTPQLINLRR